MVRTDNPDCAWLGCEWDWSTEPCVCGRSHTFRICARCLTPDDSETERCPHASSRAGELGVIGPNWLTGGMPGQGKSVTRPTSEGVAWC